MIGPMLSYLTLESSPVLPPPEQRGLDISVGYLISYHRLSGAVHISLRNTN
jgi:hypothetical protein